MHGTNLVLAKRPYVGTMMPATPDAVHGLLRFAVGAGLAPVAHAFDDAVDEL